MTGSLSYVILGQVEIVWLGHSCFRVKGSQAAIITDPYPPELGYSLGKQTARVVTVSHAHLTHSYVQGVSGEPKLIKGPGEYEVSGIPIIGVAAFHDAERGSIRGKNTVYVMEVDGVAVCHLGDLGHVLTADQVEQIDNVDVLLLPVGGGTTISASAAAEVIRQLEPKAVVPMHYRTPVSGQELEPVETFLKEMGMEQVAPQPKLSFTRSNLPLSTQVFVLSY